MLYAYNLGGKDGIPYRINLGDYDDVVDAMSGIVKSIKTDGSEKEHILKVLNREMNQAYFAQKQLR
jgi:hypothetical protein